jgi:hypothetical protein
MAPRAARWPRSPPSWISPAPSAAGLPGWWRGPTRGPACRADAAVSRIGLPAAPGWLSGPMPHRGQGRRAATCPSGDVGLAPGRGRASPMVESDCRPDALSGGDRAAAPPLRRDGCYSAGCRGCELRSNRQQARVTQLIAPTLYKSGTPEGRVAPGTAGCLPRRSPRHRAAAASCSPKIRPQSRRSRTFTASIPGQQPPWPDHAPRPVFLRLPGLEAEQGGCAVCRGKRAAASSRCGRKVVSCA